MFSGKPSPHLRPMIPEKGLKGRRPTARWDEFTPFGGCRIFAPLSEIQLSCDRAGCS